MFNLVDFDLLKLLHKMLHNIITKENQSKQHAGAYSEICGFYFIFYFLKQNSNRYPARVKAGSVNVYLREGQRILRGPLKVQRRERNQTNGLTNLVFSPLVAEPSNHINTMWSPLLF